MPDIPCRVTTLEADLDNESQANAEFRKEVRHTLSDIAKTLHDMELKREKQISYIGGIATVIGFIGTVFGFIINKYF